MVRTDLSLTARERLDACVLPNEVEPLHEAIVRCVTTFAAVGREMALRVGCEYPEALEAEARWYAGQDLER